MKANLNKSLAFAVFFFITVSAFVLAVVEPPKPGDWKGYASINGTIAPDTTPVSAHLGGSSTAAASTTVGAVEASTGYYLIHVPSGGTNVTFKICGITAYPSNETPQTWSAGPHPQGNSPYYNISVNKQANGAACTYACGCTGGYCNSGVCASSAPAAAVNTDNTGGTGTGSSSGTTPVTEEKKTETSDNKVPEKITDAETVNEIVSALNPADLGVSEIISSKVDVVKTETASETKTATVEKIESVAAVVKDDAAKQAIETIKSEITSSGSQAVSVSAKLEVFNVTSKETNKTTVVSKITLTVKAANDMKDFKLVEMIPKDVAKNVSEIVFKVQPKVLQADPIVQWNFDSISKGETKDLSYTVGKKISGLSTTSLAAAKVQEQPKQSQEDVKPGAIPPVVEPPNLTAIIIAAIIIAAGAAAYFIFVRRNGFKKYA